MDRPKPKYPITKTVSPIPPAPRRGSAVVLSHDGETMTTKDAVIWLAYVTWQRRFFGEPDMRGVLRRAANAHLRAYLGRAPEAHEVEETTKRIMKMMRAKRRIEVRKRSCKSMG